MTDVRPELSRSLIFLALATACSPGNAADDGGVDGNATSMGTTAGTANDSIDETSGNPSGGTDSSATSSVDTTGSMTTGATASETEGEDESSGEPPWEGCVAGGGFSATPTPWAIPFATDNVFDGGTTINWTINDYDGDGYVDLINGLGAPPVGVSEWEVFFGGPGGFAAEPHAWAIPFATDNVFDGGTTINWTINDYDGDGLVDLINGLGAPPVGVSEWEVFFGDGTSFAAEPVSWSIPFATDNVFDGGTTINWTINDYDGDGIQDLINGLGAPPVGVSEWEVFFGGANGFAATPHAWSIPFATDNVFDGGTTINWTIADYDGDGFVDLINGLGAPPIGVTEWEVYFGNGESFAASPVSWAIPFPSDNVFDGGTTINWTVNDYDGDGYVDLINALGPAPVGVSEWEVYFGDEGGFAAEPSSWAVPFASDQVFDRGTTINWTVTDYDGDGIQDFITALGAPPTGVTQWEVYFGECY